MGGTGRLTAASCHARRCIVPSGCRCCPRPPAFPGQGQALAADGTSSLARLRACGGLEQTRPHPKRFATRHRVRPLQACRTRAKKASPLSQTSSHSPISSSRSASVTASSREAMLRARALPNRTRLPQQQLPLPLQLSREALRVTLVAALVANPVRPCAGLGLEHLQHFLQRISHPQFR